MPSDAATRHPVQWSRALWAAAEPFTLGALFTPEARAAVTELGVSGLGMFIALRGAPLGRADSAVVAAAFHAFPRAVFAESLTPLWAQTDPTDVIEAHRASLPVMAARIYADSIDPDRLEIVGRRLEQIVADLDTAGRPLAAANQAVAARTEPWARFWQASSTLREYRGDGHIAALVSADLDVLEAQVLTTTWGAAHIDTAMLRESRGYDDDRWAAATARLAARGLVDATGVLTPAGSDLREHIEAQTDRAAARPWNALSAAECQDLYAFYLDLSTRLIDSGGMRPRTAVGAPWPPPQLT